jgi:hypothetical protein
MEYGPVRTWPLADVQNLYKKYLNVVKECEPNEGCFTDDIVKKNDGSNDVSYGGYKALVLGDGTTMLIKKGYGAGIKSYGLAPEDETNPYSATFQVDLNGAKPPNQFGYDTFAFVLIHGKGFMPLGYYSEDKCIYSCASYVLREGKLLEP